MKLSDKELIEACSKSCQIDKERFTVIHHKLRNFEFWLKHARGFKNNKFILPQTQTWYIDNKMEFLTHSLLSSFQAKGTTHTVGRESNPTNEDTRKYYIYQFEYDFSEYIEKYKDL